MENKHKKFEDESFIHRFFTKCFEQALENRVPRIAMLAQEQTLSGIFTYIGLDRMRQMLDEAEKQGNKYISLAEMWSRIQIDNHNKDVSDAKWSLFNMDNKITEIISKIQK